MPSIKHVYNSDVFYVIAFLPELIFFSYNNIP